MAIADLVVPMRRALEAAWGGVLTLGESERLSNRDHVTRVAVRDAAGETTSVVVKEPRPDSFRQFASEWAALEALGSVGLPVPPRLLAASADPPFLVMEDVGGGPSLAGLLLGDERVAASAALVTFAEGLADLHTAGIAHVDLFEARMHALGCEPTATTYDAAFPLRDNRAAWTAALAELGIDASAIDADLDEIAAALTEPGPFRGIVHGDPCPDNVRFVDGRLRVFDFEYAFVGHVLLDATYLSVPFPTCWCVASLPASLVAPANAAYRARLGMVDATHWDHQESLAWAAWLVASIPRQLEQTRDENPEWGVSTLRARVAGRLTRFVERTTAVDELPALTETMRRMRDLLVARWPDDDTELPAYPAFAEPGERVATPAGLVVGDDVTPMHRIVVVGAPGSGKTTTATEIAGRLGLPRIELDALYWGPNWTPVDKETLRHRLGATVAGDEWVIDGNYFSVGSADIVWPRADTIVFLDLPKRTAVRRVFIRTIRRAILRTELWSGNRETIRNSFLAHDSILRFVWNEYPKYRIRYRALEHAPTCSHLQWIRLRSGTATRRVAPNAAMTQGAPEREPVLVQLPAPAAPSAIVLLLHGGRESGYGHVPARRLSFVRMHPFARAVHERSRDVAVALLRYRYRGWNAPDADPVLDTEWALEHLVDTYGTLPVILVGHSMGGRAALRAAGHPQVVAIAGLAPWIPAGEPVDQLEARDVLLMHGTADLTTRPKATVQFARTVAPIARRVACVEITRSSHGMLQRARLWHELTASYVDNVVNGSPLPASLLEAFAAGARGKAIRI